MSELRRDIDSLKAPSESATDANKEANKRVESLIKEMSELRASLAEVEGTRGEAVRLNNVERCAWEEERKRMVSKGEGMERGIRKERGGPN